MNQRKVLITGAARGIGRAISEKYAASDFELLTPSHGELDLSLNVSVDRYIAKLEAPVDVLINCAGINPLGEIAEINDEDLEETLRINLISPMRLVRGVTPFMIEKRYGRIINVSSIWSVVSKPGRGVYAATKSGLNSLTRSLAVELGKYNILVNAVSPGFVETDLTAKNNTPQQLAVIRTQIPLGRLAKVEEIAEIVFYLGSEKNTYITGQNIIIDGGYTCL